MNKVDFKLGDGLTRFVFDLYKDHYDFVGDPLIRLDYKKDTTVEVDHANKTFTIEQ